jgi:hypothetical protein
MSSAISTDPVGLPPSRNPSADRRSLGDGGQPDQAALQPWQFFVLVALACATAVTFVARGQGVVAVVLLGVMMAAAAFVGLAVLRAVRPLVSPVDDRTVMIGERTRAALEREKMLALRSIKELEFDRAMGKLSQGDWQEMSTRLRARASRLMRQLDAGPGYREQIEKDLAKRLGEANARLKPSHYTGDEEPDTRSANGLAERLDTRSAKASAERACTSCATVNDADARFCKGCGGKL